MGQPSRRSFLGRLIVICHPVSFSSDGRDVLIDVEGKEWGRLHSESLRDLLVRSIRTGYGHGIERWVE